MILSLYPLKKGHYCDTIILLDIKEMPLLYICPICKKNLTLKDNSYCCKNRHVFDISRNGYVNLLTTKGRNPKVAGDNAEMIKSRSSFLDGDYYQPLADKVSEIIKKDSEKRNLSNPTIIDSGCGEGYYTSCFAENNPSAYIYGIDISKHGIAHASSRMKAKNMSHVFLAVASSFDLPFSNKCCDSIISIFAPVCNDEYARVLKSGGKLFIVAPDEDHLFGLKKILYDVPYKNKENNYGLTNFILTGKYSLKYNINLKSNDDIESLFMMTPYYYKTSKPAQERLLALSNLETECDFIIYEYKKRS